MKVFLKPPDFGNRLQNMRATLLNGILIVSFFCTIIIGIMLYLFVPESRDKLYILGWTLVTIGVVKFILQQGHLQMASFAAIILTWVMVTASVSTDYGVYTPAMSAYVIVILLAGMFMTKWGGVYTAILITITSSVIVYLMNQNMIVGPISPAHPPEQIVMVYSFNFIIAAILVFLVHDNVEDTLQRNLDAEKALIDTLETAQKNKERFRLISSVTSDYTFSARLSPDGQPEYTFLTGAFQTITGYTQEEFLKTGGWRETLYSEDLAQDDRDMATLRQNKPVRSELRVIRKDGQVRWVRIYAIPVWDEENDCLIGINGGVQDITDRKQAEYVQRVLFDISKARTETDDLHELLKYTHEKLQTLLSAANFYVALYDPKTELYSFPYGVDEKDDDWTDRSLKNSLTDYVRRSGKPMIITDETHDQLSEKLGLEIIDSWSEVWLGAPLKTSHGVIGVMAVQDYDSSHTYSQEDVELLSHVSENIAWVIESKRNEEILKQERNLLRTIIDSIPDSLFVKDVQSRYILSNRANTQLMGLYAPDTSDDSSSIIPVDLNSPIELDYKPFLEEEKQIIETGQPILGSEKLIEHPKTGQKIWLLVTKIPFYDNDQEIAGIIGVGHDITELKRAEREQIELELQRERVEFYREFINSMTHDLKTPVSAIKATTYLLSRIDDSVKRNIQIEKLDQQVNRLQRMIEDILTVARLDHIPEHVFEELSINQILREVEKQLEAKAQQKKIIVELDLAPDIPDIRASHDDLLRAFLNLLENAVNYTPKGGHVLVRSYTEDTSWVVCEIKDSGIGIEEADLPRIFEQFYRAPNARQFEEGTGLGLAIVKKIIDLHQGEIEVHTIVRNGTTFLLKFPCV